MKIACLCPQYGHAPQPLANAIACFLAQRYPHDLKRLFILDDSGQLDAHVGSGYEIRSERDRLPSLPAKYDYMRSWAAWWQPDAWAVWDSDDIYLPNHLESAARALQCHSDAWWKPDWVWSLYTGELAYEAAQTRFHGSLVVGVDAVSRLGGWLGVMPAGSRNHMSYLFGDRRADFDQRMIARLQSELPRSEWYPDQPTYVYRWKSSRSKHCSALMRAPHDETWYERHAETTGPIPIIGRLAPRFDENTIDVFRELQIPIQEALAWPSARRPE